MDIAKLRLSRSFLAQTSFISAREVVHALGAVQAQDYDGAKWAIARRTVGLDDAAIEAEFSRGEIIRTHVLRPTWHFVDPLDLRWMLALTGPLVMKRMTPYDQHLALDDKVYRRSNAAIEHALRGGRYLTRNELKAELTRARLGELGVQRLAHIVMRAELEAIICSGPRRGKQFTYALVEERVPPAAPKDRDAAIHELTLRYFRARSPATPADFGWWSGLPMSDVQKGIELASEELEEVTIGGRTYWSTGDRVARPRPSAHLLPNYDEFFIGYRDRSAIGGRLKSTKIVTGGSTLIGNVIALDGQLAGGWRRSVGKDATTLTFDVLARLTPSEMKRIRSEIKRYCSFLGRPVAVSGLDDTQRKRERR